MNQYGAICEESHPGGRVFFSDAGRTLVEEDEIELTSVGVDIGSSTSHLLFSTIVLQRRDTRYVVTGRTVLFESDILLTPYASGNAIDADALGIFVRRQYADAGLTPDDIDTGALILTGVAARRSNARAIGELFAAEAGKFVAISAGDSLESLMAAHGSGAVALSRDGDPVLNIDIGGGTTKIALCRNGEVAARTAIDVGARLIGFDDTGQITRLEPFGARHLAECGLVRGVGDRLSAQDRRLVAGTMAECVRAAVRGQRIEGFMGLPPLPAPEAKARLVFSGGVSECMAGHPGVTDDLGSELAAAVREAFSGAGEEVVPARQRIRATVVGASQYTVQVSGSTIFVDPSDALPLRNVAVIAPRLDLGETIGSDAIAAAVSGSLARLDLSDGARAVAVALTWQGSASYGRLAALARGVVGGLRPILDRGHPLILVVDGDVGGLLGMQCRTEEHVPGAIVSIDGIALSEFDFIDIGQVIRSTGAAPVVVKSLLFPTE